MIKLMSEINMDTKEMRAAYCEALIEAAEKDPRIVSIDCDLSSSCGTAAFRQAFPERAFNIGIQEANGCGMAAGMAVAGLNPFFHSFAVFSSRRIYDQLFLSCAYADANVKIIGCDAGISATYNGGTHMSFEDIGILREIPNITILEPTDTAMMKALVSNISHMPGVIYMRTPRKLVPRIYKDDSTFAIGKANILREGKDVSIIATGMLVSEALKAASLLAQRDIHARVVDMFTIKPIDKATIIECAQKTGAIVTAENHNIIGGLGSAVAEVLSENRPAPLARIGVQDQFGEVGDEEYLRSRFKLTAEEICLKVEEVLRRKIAN